MQQFCNTSGQDVHTFKGCILGIGMTLNLPRLRAIAECKKARLVFTKLSKSDKLRPPFHAFPCESMSPR